jgi:glycosyltransferase involved in cell wall biosynthesis
MREGKRIGVVIPALNEAAAIVRVLADIPAWVDAVIVADNGSIDGTGDAARGGGATVVVEPERGYGAACLAGIAALPPVDIVVFLDGDYSDHPADMADLVDPIASGSCDFVLASRAIGQREAGSLTPQQLFGNWLATTLIRRIWGAQFTDLGPFRAIARPALTRLAMADRNFGWTVEMQIKAAEQGLRCREVPARYRRRIGVSKVSGTVVGSVKAGGKILYVIGREAVRRAGGKRAAG